MSRPRPPEGVTPAYSFAGVPEHVECRTEEAKRVGNGSDEDEKEEQKANERTNETHADHPTEASLWPTCRVHFTILQPFPIPNTTHVDESSLYRISEMERNFVLNNLFVLATEVYVVLGTSSMDFRILNQNSASSIIP